jgi:hypothetical protein
LVMAPSDFWPALLKSLSGAELPVSSSLVQMVKIRGTFLSYA